LDRPAQRLGSFKELSAALDRLSRVGFAMKDHQRRETLGLITGHTRNAAIINDSRVDVLVERRRVRGEISAVREADQRDLAVGVLHLLNIGSEIADELCPGGEALHA